jgi:membrane protein
VGVVTFLVLATGAVLELQDDLNRIWKVSAASSGIWELVRTRLLSIALVIGFGFLLLVSLVLDAGLSALGTYLEQGLSGATLALKSLNAGVSFGIAVLLFAMIYKILPDVELTWRDVGVGAVVTGVLFTIGKIMIGWYLGTSGVASSYGAAASLITILLWIYYSSLIILFGAEFTKAYAEQRGSRRHIRSNDATATLGSPISASEGPARERRRSFTAPSGSSGAGRRH